MVVDSSMSLLSLPSLLVLDLDGSYCCSWLRKEELGQIYVTFKNTIFLLLFTILKASVKVMLRLLMR